MGCSGSNTLNKTPVSKSSNSVKTTNVNTMEDIKISTQMMIGENKSHVNKYYKMTEKLGAGTFGKVYKCLHIPSNSYRAMKIVKRDSVNYQDDEKTFLKEIEVLSKLDHPNIVKIFEYFVDDNNYYVVSELIQGGELYEQLIKVKTYSEATAAIILEQLFSAVYYLHENNIVHRDLKPENIMMEMMNTEGNDFFIKLIDFGSANYYDREKLSMKIGTAYYIAPEVLNNKYNNKCDLWSCGVIMYILLSGSPPFQGEDDQEVMQNVRKGKFDFFGTEWDGISPSAKDLISKLLTMDQAKRISASDALKHPWLTLYNKRISTKIDEKQLKLLSNNLRNLKKINSKHKLHQACIAFIVHQLATNSITKDLRSIFKKMDISNDGRLTIDEVRGGYQKFFKSSNITEKEFEDLIKLLDQDNNEYIEYEEFLRAFLAMDSILTEKNIEMAFNYFDKDGSGKLSPEEIKGVLNIYHEDKQKEMEIVNNIISDIDVNGDGEISFEEFKLLMKRHVSSSD
jgi:calcium-dependent protein kinase